MKSFETLSNIPEQSQTQDAWPPILTRLHAVGFAPYPDARPARSRTIVFDPSGSAVLLIRRGIPRRPTYEPHFVFPGGRLERSDPSAIDGAWRELYEETRLEPSEVTLTGNVLEYGSHSQYYFLGVTNEPNPALGLAADSPEAAKNPSKYGTYAPTFVTVDHLAHLKLFPQEIARTIVAQSTYL